MKLLPDCAMFFSPEPKNRASGTRWWAGDSTSPFKSRCRPYSVHPSPYTLHPAHHTRHPKPCTLLSAPFTLHPAPYSLHPSPYTRHPTLYTLDPTPACLPRPCLLLLYHSSSLDLSDTQSMSLEYEPSSEPLHVSVKSVFLNREPTLPAPPKPSQGDQIIES